VWRRGTAVSRAVHAAGGAGRGWGASWDGLECVDVVQRRARYSVCVATSQSWSLLPRSCCRSRAVPPVWVHVVYYGPARRASTVGKRDAERDAAGGRATALRKVVGVGSGAFLLAKARVGERGHDA
jgi:hypothetical protein